MMKLAKIILLFIVLGAFKVVSQTEIASNAKGVFISKDDKGAILLNWSEQVNKNQFVLKYVEFDDYGNRKSEIKTVLPTLGMQSHAESMAKIIRSAKGILYVVFRIKTSNPKSRFGGHIYYTMSTDNGKTWHKKQKLVKIKNTRSQSFYDVTLLSDGEVGISWLDSRKLEKNKDGSTLYFSKTNGINGFVKGKPIAGSTCQCCRTEIFRDSKNNIHIAFRNITEGSIRDMYSVVSTNNGHTFSELRRIGKDNWKLDGCPHTGPSLAGNNKSLAAVWYTGAESGDGIFFKELTKEYTAFENKVLLTATGAHPQMIASKDEQFHVVYEEFYKEKEKLFSQIVLHTIRKNQTLKKQIISQKRTDSDHAVITTTKNNKLFIAWISVIKGKSKVFYKKVG